MADKLRQIAVKGKGTDGKVVLWERHPEHPEEGEAFISNDGKTRMVAETADVRRALGEGTLVEGSASDVEVKRGLRKATDEEERAAGLTDDVEKKTAVTPTDKPSTGPAAGTSDKTKG